MTPEEHFQQIERYAEGSQVLRDAYDATPEDMRTWRPTPDTWSVHEIIGHCADAEATDALKLRVLAGEYHPDNTDLALGVIDAVRSWTTTLLRAITDEQWERADDNSETGAFSGTAWLAIYSNHLHEHADAIRANIVAWEART